MFLQRLRRGFPRILGPQHQDQVVVQREAQELLGLTRLHQVAHLAEVLHHHAIHGQQQHVLQLFVAHCEILGSTPINQNKIWKGNWAPNGTHKSII